MMSVKTAGKNAQPADHQGKAVNMIEGAAVSGSILCLVHCLALPLLLLALPGIIGLYLQSEIFHYAALGLLAPAACAAFWLGIRRHGSVVPASIGVLGIACLTLALVPHFGEGAEVVGTIIGSVLLVAGHLMNWRLRARCR